MTLIAIGVALNVLVIALNQGMPTKDDVRERDGREVHVPIEQTVKHRPQEDDDLLGFLGDVITAPGFPNQQFSIGDIVMGLGIVDLCFEGSRVPRRRGLARAVSRAQHELIVEQAAPVEHDLERREHLRVVEVLRRRAQRFEREAGPVRRGRRTSSSNALATLRIWPDITDGRDDTFWR